MRSDTFKNNLEALGAVFGTWRDADVVLNYGDAHAEYSAVRAGGLGIADRSERETVVATGDDVVQLLQGLVTGDIFALAEPGSGQINTAVNLQGRLVTDLRIMHGPDVLLLDLEPGMVASGALKHFKRNIINEDAKLTDRSAVTARILVTGARALDIVGRVVVGLSRPLAHVEMYGGAWGRVAGHDVVVQMLPLTGEPAFELYMDIDAQPDVWAALFAAAPDAQPVGHQALEMLRIEAGVPRFGVELDEKVIPLEADMNYAIAYNKGCYLGQEIIARLDTLGTPAKFLRTLVFDGDVPEVGADIFAGEKNKKVGTIRSAIFSDVLERPIALAYIKRDFNAVGQTVRLGDESAEIRELGVLDRQVQG